MAAEPAFEPMEPQQEKDDGNGLRRVLVAVFALLALGLLLWWLLSRIATVPDIIGLSEEDARTEIEDAGLTVGNVGDTLDEDAMAGEVVGQAPESGSRILRGSDVDFTIAMGGTGEDGAGGNDTSGSTGGGTFVPLPPYAGDEDEGDDGPYVPPTPSVGPLVPLVMGISESDARATLASAGYGVRVTFGDSSTAVPVGHVMFQDPPPDTPKPRGTTVTIQLSTGPPGTDNAN